MLRIRRSLTEALQCRVSMRSACPPPHRTTLFDLLAAAMGTGHAAFLVIGRSERLRERPVAGVTEKLIGRSLVKVGET